MTDDSSSGTIPLLSRLRPPEGAVRSKKRKGRGHGSGLGKTAGRGQKGQKARHPGRFSKVGFEGGQMPLVRRLPKVGFRNPFSIRYRIVNIGALNRFEEGSTVDGDLLRGVGLVHGKDIIKVLGKGELHKALTVRAHAFS